MSPFKNQQYLRFVILVLCLLLDKGGFGSPPFRDRIALKVGASYSLTQLGASPFSELRRWYDRGLAAPFLYFEYAQPIKKNELVIGIQLIEKGFINRIESSPTNPIQVVDQYQYRLSYLEMPVLYKFNFTKYAITAGAYIAYLYDNTYRENFSTSVPSNPQSPYNTSFPSSGQYPHPEHFKSWDSGFTLGVSRKLTPSLFIDFSYQKGLVDIDNRNSEDLKYNTSFLLGLRYKFLSSQ